MAKSLTREKHYLAAQAAELERLKRELDGAVNHHAHNMNRIDRALGEPRYEDCYLVQAFERRIAEKDAELERLREQLSEADLIIGSTNKQAGNHAEARHALTPALRDSIHRYILRWHSTGNET